MNMQYIDALERNELEKAIVGRGVDYDTAQKIVDDYDKRLQHLYQVLQMRQSRQSLIGG